MARWDLFKQSKKEKAYSNFQKIDLMIKIIKSDRLNWYSNQIGENFHATEIQTYPDGKKNYWLDNKKAVGVDDAEIIKVNSN